MQAERGTSTEAVKIIKKKKNKNKVNAKKMLSVLARSNYVHYSVQKKKTRSEIKGPLRSLKGDAIKM